MNNKYFINIYSLIIILIIFINNVTSKNTLLLLADDGGFEMGAYLNHYCQTPNLDALAKKSLIFNNAFTSVSSCSPSRAQILTGQPSHQNGMYGLHNSVHHFNVFDSIISLPKILQDHNIYTGLIGKKHLGPDKNFQFDFEETEEKHSINQIGRNITNIKLYVREFLHKFQSLKSNTNNNKEQEFFLMIGFHDPHRCGHITPQYGEFCERWGSGEINMGNIPDWKPIYYDWRNIQVPYYLPNNDYVKKDLAAQYMTISRLDQGIGLIINELKQLNLFNDTVIIYTSDNGVPFPNGRTNFYEPGIREPMFIYSPDLNVRRNSITYSMTSLLDLYPTILDIYHINYTNFITSNYSKSLLPLLLNEPIYNENDTIYGSYNYHEITMNYPMRMIRNQRYKLIHNINYLNYYPIDQDLYTSDTFQYILNSTINNLTLPWYKTLQTYYIRPEWELYDLKLDPSEKWNLYHKIQYNNIKMFLHQKLMNWQIDTKDPWRCAPHAVLEETGYYKNQPKCLTLGHETIKNIKY